MQERWRWVRLGIEIFLPAFFVLVGFGKPVTGDNNAMLGIRVKYVLKDSIYLEAGSNVGLSKGQKLFIMRAGTSSEAPVVVAEMEIESIASTSAAGRVIDSKMEVIPGDRAYSSQTAFTKAQLQQPAAYKPTAATKTANAASQQGVSEGSYKAPLREVNRIRGRVGLDYNALQIPGSGVASSQFGFMLSMDATRIGGTYWSVKGNYRGRFQSRKSPTQQKTLTDLINRTYHLSLNYDNPSSAWVAGFGRLYVPGASSLSTIDGMYFGRRFGKQTVGFFGGTTPDPSSWNYNPDRQMAGAFINTEHGSFESFRLSSTVGVAMSRIDWHPERQFGFSESGIFYKHYLSVYNNLEVDLRTASQNQGEKQFTLSRSYTTVRLQPHKVISFDINENYFRNIPTFDPRLIGTGLLDKFLFQGVSGGFRLALPHHIGIFGNTGRSSRTGDQKASWNYSGGASMADILHSGIRGEYRYSRFDSSFGQGIYQSAGINREVGEDLQFELQAGLQKLTSVYTNRDRARFINGNVDWYVGRKYSLGAGLTVYRGQDQNYNQYFVSFGYRFDNHRWR
jgi:hypothetical protein